MTAEIPKEVPVEQTGPSELKPVNIAPYQVLLDRVFGGKAELHLLSPDKEQALIEAATEVLATLTPRMRKVLDLRYDLSGQGRHTLNAVGRLLDPPVTAERIRQLEAAALRRLRHPSRSRKLMAFLPLPENSIAKSIAELDLLYKNLWPAREVKLGQLGQLGELISHLTEALRDSPLEISSLAGFLGSDRSFVTDRNLSEPVVRWMGEELRKAYQDAKEGKYRVEQPQDVSVVALEGSPVHEGTPIDELPLLNTWIINLLKRNHLTTVESLVQLTEEDLLHLRNMGPQRTAKVKAALNTFYLERRQTTLEAVREELRRPEARRISDMVFELFTDPKVNPVELQKLKALIEKLATTSSQPQP